MANYSMGHMAVMLAWTRYVSQMKNLPDEVSSGDVNQGNAVLAATYLMGLSDMANLYLDAVESESATKSIDFIDSKLADLKAGRYPDDELEEEPTYES